MMSEETIHNLVCDLFLGGDRDSAIDPDTNLLSEGICDSLGLVQLAAAIEKNLPGIRIRDQEITPESFGSISRIAGFVRAKANTRA